MPRTRNPLYTAFVGDTRVASGDLRSVARAAKTLIDADPRTRVSVFDDATGRMVDLDLRGTQLEVDQRLENDTSAAVDVPPTTAKRGPGRPRLGVVSGEVTLLPRHWAWLRAQRGSASATLRRLVDEARRTQEGRHVVRRAQDAAYRFMSATVGDEPGFEEAVRALYRGDQAGFESAAVAWPHDLLVHSRKLAADALRGTGNRRTQHEEA